jgi:hypothetical protein
MQNNMENPRFDIELTSMLDRLTVFAEYNNLLEHLSTNILEQSKTDGYTIQEISIATGIQKEKVHRLLFDMRLVRKNDIVTKTYFLHKDRVNKLEVTIFTFAAGAVADYTINPENYISTMLDDVERYYNENKKSRKIK